jgi:hypothetical protein
MSESVHPFRNRDLAARKRALERDIALKADSRPKVDNQGHRTGPPVLYEYDSLGMLIGPAHRDHGDKTAKEAGIE